MSVWFSSLCLFLMGTFDRSVGVNECGSSVSTKYVKFSAKKRQGRTWYIRSVVFFGFRVVFVAPALLTRPSRQKFADVIVSKHVTVDENDVRKV